MPRRAANCNNTINEDPEENNLSMSYDQIVMNLDFSANLSKLKSLSEEENEEDHEEEHEEEEHNNLLDNFMC